MRWLGVGSALMGLAAVAALAPVAPRTIERVYSTLVYPPIQAWVTPMSSGLPFAVLDALILGAVAGAAWFTTRQVRSARQLRSRRPLAHLLAVFMTVSASLYIVFLLLWGLNYRRLPMKDRLVLDEDAPSTMEVRQWGEEAVRRLNALHPTAHAQGWTDIEVPGSRLAMAAVEVQQELTGVEPVLPTRLKRSMLGPYFRWTGVDGMINPFGLEVLENPDLLPFERPFVAAHEWAHLAGFADESEASFVGFLSCMRASEPSQYSGWMFVYWQIAAELERDDRARLWDAVGEGPRRDVAAMTERMRRGERPLVRQAGWRVYDQYLKANRVPTGVRSYGAVVNLLVRARLDPDWRPRLAQPRG